MRYENCQDINDLLFWVKTKMFNNYKSLSLTIMGRKYNLWVADDSKKKMQGLKGVRQIPRNRGMLFVYDEDVDNNFTMVGVKIPLKIIFLDKDYRVIDAFNASPGQSGINPGKKYRYVIEISKL